VQGKEYGPVDTATLREWRGEGRLIPANELRRVDEERWIPAGELPEVFADAELPPSPAPPAVPVGARTWPELLADTFRIYRGGFGRFMFFGLLSSVPMFVLQWTFPKVPLPDLRSGSYSLPSETLPPISIAMLVVLLFAWPVSVAGFQFVADDVLRGQARSLGALLSSAARSWGRMLAAALLVYGSYFFWFFVPLVAMFGLIGSGEISALGLLICLFVGGFMVYMNARLFINFLFWPQTAVLGPDRGLAALRNSKELARSAPDAPLLDRPLYRGAIVASVWLLALLVLTLVVQFPFMLARLSGIQNPEEAMALMQKVAQAQTPDALTIGADIATWIMNLLLRPILASAFLVLYYDAKARLGRNGKEITSE